MRVASRAYAISSGGLGRGGVEHDLVGGARLRQHLRQAAGDSQRVAASPAMPILALRES